MRVSTVQFRPSAPLPIRVRQKLALLEEPLEPTRNALKMAQLCPKLSPRESKGNQLQPTPAKMQSPLLSKTKELRRTP